MKVNKSKLLELNKTFNQLGNKLRKYIKRKLHIGAKNNIISKKFYSVEGVLDDVYLMSFDELEKMPDKFNAKVSLLKNTIRKLDEILKTEGFFSNRNKIHISQLLKEELSSLKEEFTTDGDGDLIPFEELDDISYHLIEDEDKIQLIDEDTAVPLDGTTAVNEEMLLDEAYGNTGFVSRTIFELAVLGEVSAQDISEALEVDSQDVKAVIQIMGTKLINQ